jgi:hypothetical protein
MDSELILNMYYTYDLQIDKYKNYASQISSFKEIKSKNDLESNILEFYDSKGKKILKASYQYLGRYYEKDDIWKWGWSMDMHKSLNYFIKKIFDYGFNIVTVDKEKKEVKNNSISSVIKNIIINSIIKIKNIEFILALSLYITKAEYIWIAKEKDFNNYFLLKDIEII